MPSPTPPRPRSDSPRIAIEADEDLEPLTSVELRFRLFAGDTAVFDETHPEVTVEDGLVFAALGRIDPSGNPLDDSLFNGDKLELEIAVNGEATEPRLEILSVPYATRAGRAEVAERLGDLSPEDVARADHNHDSEYLPATGTLTCGPNEKVTGIDVTTGDVQCAADVDTDTTVQAAPNGGLVRIATR